jgi:hypothetical protein
MRENASQKTKRRLALRDECGWLAPAWEAHFDTVAGAWTTVRLPWRDFQRAGFGWTWRDGGRVPQLRLRHIHSLQILLSKFECAPRSCVMPDTHMRACSAVSMSMHTHATDALARRSDVARAGVHVGAPCHERAHHTHARGGGLNPFFAEGPFELLVQRIEAYRRPSPASASASAATQQQQAPSGAHTESAAARNEWVDREEEEEEEQQQAAPAKTDARSAGERAAAIAAADEAAELAARAAAGAAQAAQAAEAAEAAADVAAVLS